MVSFANYSTKVPLVSPRTWFIGNYTIGSIFKNLRAMIQEDGQESPEIWLLGHNLNEGRLLYRLPLHYLER